MKKFLAFLLVAILALSCVSFAAAEDRVGADPELVAAAQA